MRKRTIITSLSGMLCFLCWLCALLVCAVICVVVVLFVFLFFNVLSVLVVFDEPDVVGLCRNVRAESRLLFYVCFWPNVSI